MNLESITPPYYAVIFSSEKAETIGNEYQKLADKMINLAKEQEGYLGHESISTDMKSITISYWRDMQSINEWKAHPEHQLSQDIGKSKWYKSYTVKICRIDSVYAAEF